MAKRIFSIEWDDNLGPLWMNKDNLQLVMETPEHINPELGIKIEDLTGQIATIKQGGYRPPRIVDDPED